MTEAALLPRPARRRHRRRELGGAGGGLLQRATPAGHDARAADARGLDVPLPHRADRPAPQRPRCAPARAPSAGDGRRAPERACVSAGPTARRTCRWTPASSSSAPAPRTDWLRDVVARDERGFILAGLDAKEAGWPLPRDPYLAGDDGARGCSSPATSERGRSSGSPARSARAPCPSRSSTSTWSTDERVAPRSPTSARSTCSTSSTTRRWRSGRPRPRSREVGPGVVIAEEGSSRPGLQLLLAGEVRTLSVHGAAEEPVAPAGRRRRGWGRSPP